MEKRNTDNVDDSLRTAVTETEKNSWTSQQILIQFFFSVRDEYTLYKNVICGWAKKSFAFYPRVECSFRMIYTPAGRQFGLCLGLYRENAYTYTKEQSSDWIRVGKKRIQWKYLVLFLAFMIFNGFSQKSIYQRFYAVGILVVLLRRERRILKAVLQFRCTRIYWEEWCCCYSLSADAGIAYGTSIAVFTYLCEEWTKLLYHIPFDIKMISFSPYDAVQKTTWVSISVSGLLLELLRNAWRYKSCMAFGLGFRISQTRTNYYTTIPQNSTIMQKKCCSR